LSWAHCPRELGQRCMYLTQSTQLDISSNGEASSQGQRLSTETGRQQDMRINTRGWQSEPSAVNQAVHICGLAVLCHKCLHGWFAGQGLR
jgi:hypothetical protein